MTSKTHDLPFIYVTYFDAFTIGAAPNTTIQLALNAPFHLRRAVWQARLRPNYVEATPASGFSALQVYDRQNRSLTGSLGLPGFTPSEPLPSHQMLLSEFFFLPESVFQPQDALHFDAYIYPTITQIIPVAPYTPFSELRPICFQGVHRFPQQKNAGPMRKGNYFERPFQYPITISLTAPGGVPYLSTSANFETQIHDYDFEVRRVLIVDKSKTNDSSTNGVVGYSMGGMFAYIIQDAYSQALMNGPVPDWALAYNANFFANCFPVPALIYPVGSSIKVQAFNIWEQSGLAGNDTCEQQLIFDGVQRIPCA